jgi:hypothetical protein
MATGCDYAHEGRHNLRIKLTAALALNLFHGSFVPDGFAIGPVCGHGIIGI